MNIPRANLRPMPRDFPEYAAKLGVSGLRERYKCGNIAIRRWRQECGVPPPSQTKIPPPDDFAKIAPSRTVPELKRHYGRGGGTIRRWASETGVRYKGARDKREKRNEAEEIALCLACPFPKCKSNCGRVAGC